MRKFAILTLAVLKLATFVALGQAEIGWNGIVPLKTTRSDVGRLLGKPKFVYENSDLFFREDEKVSVEYASGPCEGLRPHWNVSKGTVVSMLVKPMKTISFDAKMLGPEFVRGAVQDDLSVEYANAVTGVKYTVNEFGELSSIRFSPSGAAKVKHTCK